MTKECPHPGCSDTLYRGGVNGQLLCCFVHGPIEIIEQPRVFKTAKYPKLTRGLLQRLLK